MTGERSKSESLHAIGCRIVCELSSHCSLQTRTHHGDNALGTLQLEYTRELCCSFYVLDSDISLRTGKPPLLPEEYCDLSLFDIMREDNDAHNSFLAYNVGLCVIKQRVSRLLHSPKTHSISDSHILEGIRSLDSELEEWRLSTPPKLRPRISIATHQFLPTIDSQQKARVIKLQLDYHYILTVLHNIVRRCGPVEGAELPEDLHGVIHSSIDVSLEAARSTLRFLKISIDTDVRRTYQ